MIQHGLEPAGCSGHGITMVAETFTGVHSYHDAINIVDCSKKLSERDEPFCACVIIEKSIWHLFEVDCLIGEFHCEFYVVKF